MNNSKIPANATLLAGKDDSGRRVLVNSIGGPSCPDDKYKKSIENTKGTVIWGPCKLKLIAQSRRGASEGPVRPTEFTTDPYWCVKLDGYNLEANFVKQELKFI